MQIGELVEPIGSSLTKAANEPVIGISPLMILCGLLITTLLLGEF